MIEQASFLVSIIDHYSTRNRATITLQVNNLPYKNNEYRGCVRGQNGAMQRLVFL